MKIYNQRSPEQWEILSEAIIWEGKTVLDLGCGRGDILARVARAGAYEVQGLDFDADEAEAAQARLNETKHPRALVAVDRIENALLWLAKYDVAICFSVLPYLANPGRVLKWMSNQCTYNFIEAQYKGDGPGDTWFVEDDADMETLLRAYWPNVTKIGQTLVPYREVYRSIWMCI